MNSRLVSAMSSSDSDFVSLPHLSKKKRILCPSIRSYLQEVLCFSSDEGRPNVNLYEFSDSDEHNDCGELSKSSVNFDVGINYIINSSYDEIENITLAERLKGKRKRTDIQCRKEQYTVNFLFREGSSSDFSGFSNVENESENLITGVTYAEIHNEDFTQARVYTTDQGSQQEEHSYIHPSLKHYNTVFALYENITSTEEKCLEFLKNNKLIPPNDTPCPKCKSNKRKGVLKYRTCNEKDRKCSLRLICSGGGSCKYRVSPFTGTFFDGTTCRISLQKVLQIIYFFLHQYRVSDARRENEVAENTITDYYNYCREVCVAAISSDPSVIGGPGEVVEIDESKFFKRKYNKGRLLSAQKDGWVFGGIQRSNKECFMVRVKDRTKETLLPLICKYIKTGTTIISDEWKAYSKLQQLGYHHSTVCHKLNFVNPENKLVHTQNIENSWRYAKSTYPERYTSEQLRDSYLQEFLYRKKYKDTLIPQFFKDISKIYKHPVI